MRLYGKNFNRKVIDRRVRASVEERDAIVWDIDESNHLAYVRIQGSNVNIKCHYHQVMLDRPVYLKKGSAVRIRHKRGIRGYTEVIGTGRAIPTPISGESELPVRSVVDEILSGMIISDSSPPSMNVQITTGSYRLNGAVYTYAGLDFEYYTMQDPPQLVMGINEVTMGSSWPIITVPNAPSTGYGRYDIFVVGTDSVVDVVEGVQSPLSQEPTMPSAPSNHVLINHVFIYGGQTVVTQDMIGKMWTAPRATEIEEAISGNLDEWGYVLFQDNAQIQVTLTATDQYGQAYNGDYLPIDLTMHNESGAIRGTITTTWGSTAQSYFGSSMVFYYRREATVGTGDDSPVISIQASDGSFSYTFVKLANYTLDFDPEA